MIYLDSSVALRTILPVTERERLREWLEEVGPVISSRLLRTEVIRVLRRESRDLREAKPLFDRIGLIDITAEVHSIAESIERHVRTLDALHLATALAVGCPSVASHDAQMCSVAGALGIEVVDPVASLASMADSFGTLDWDEEYDHKQDRRARDRKA